MANAFAITVDADAVQLDEGRRPAKISFTITNMSGQALAARARVLVEEPAGADWFRIEGAEGEFVDRDFAEQETHQYTIAVTVPPAAASGTYSFGLHVESVDFPDEYWGESPDIRVEVPAPKPVEKKKFPWWIVAVAAGVVVIVAGLLIWSPWSDGGPLEISEFSATPDTISLGESSELRWATTNADSVFLDGEHIEASGSRQVNPPATTTYQLTAKDEDEEPVLKEVTISVASATPGFTAITFAALPDGTPITGNRILVGNEFNSQGIQVAGAPETSYCSDATSAAIKLRALSGSTPTNFLTTTSPSNINRCNTVLVEILFINAVRVVRLEFFGAAAPYTINAYDSAGNLIGSAQATPQQLGQLNNVTVTSPGANIKRVTFGRQAALAAITEIRYER
jgi:hypothetical protein